MMKTTFCKSQKMTKDVFVTNVGVRERYYYHKIIVSMASGRNKTVHLQKEIIKIFFCSIIPSSLIVFYQKEKSFFFRKKKLLQ